MDRSAVSVSSSQNHPDFLSGGGQMGALMREHDWAASKLGAPEWWPQSLRTVVRLMLTTNHPVFVFWGAEHICFYNDAYMASIGPEKHPAMLGARGRDMWDEIWPIIGPQIEQVMSGKGATWHEDHLVPIVRNGQMEDVYWTYSYSPIDHADGIGGVLVLTTETTARVMAERRRVAELDRLRDLVQQAPSFATALSGPDHTFEFVNNTYRQMFTGDRDIVGLKMRDAFPETSAQGFIDLLDHVFRTGKPYVGRGARFEVADLHGASKAYYVDFISQATRDAAGDITGVFVEGYDVSENRRFENALRASEERYREVVESQVEMVCRFEPGGAVLFANLAYAANVGKTVEALTGASFWEFVAEHDRDHVRRQLSALTPAAPEIRIENRFSTSAGERWTLWTNRAIRFDEDGVPLEVQSTGIDITERKAVEDALNQSEARFRFLDEIAAATQALDDPAAIVTTTAGLLGEYLKADVCAYADMEADEDAFTIRGDWTAPGAASIVGVYSLAAFGARAVAELRAGRPLVLRDTLAEIGAEQAAMFLQLGLRATVCMPFIKGAKLTALMAVHSATPRDWTGSELALIAETVERTWAQIERVRSAAALRESEIRFRNLADAMPQLVWTAGADGRVDYYNDRRREYAGGDSPHFLEWIPLVHPDDLAETVSLWRRAMRSGEDYFCEHRLQRTDGQWFWHVSRAVAAKDANGGVVKWFGTATEVHSLKTAEAQLRELNETLEGRVASTLAERKLLADIVETTDAFVQVSDMDFRWIAFNRASAAEYKRIFGVRPVVGASMLDGIRDRPEHHDAVKAVWSRALNGEQFTDIAEFGEASRDRRFYEMKFNVLRDRAGKQIGAYQFVYDVTQKLLDQQRLAEAEDRLRQAQKMEAVGQLTGGVAHDFNNLLMAISGGLHMLDRTADPARLDRIRQGMQQAVERGVGLTRQLLAFSRRRPLEAVPVDLVARISGMAELLERTLSGAVRVEMKLPKKLAPVEIDPGEFELAILNLCVNARDAMPGGGVIVIEAKNATLGAGAMAGKVVQVAVTDTGMGIDEQTLARVFEPFFTTKEVGKGSGLGLAQVYAFASQSSGDVHIESRVGVGTTVTLTFPRSAGKPAAITNVAVSRPIPVNTDDGRTVLVVEDDAGVATMTTEFLHGLGYSVLHATNAAHALDILATDCSVALVFSDVMMPGGMSGLDLAREISRQHPTIPVLLATGYIESARSAGEEGFTLMQKPYALEDLAEAVAANLSR